MDELFIYVKKGQVICEEYNFLTKQSDVRDVRHERELYGLGGDTRAYCIRESFFALSLRSCLVWVIILLATDFFFFKF